MQVDLHFMFVTFYKVTYVRTCFVPCDDFVCFLFLFACFDFM